jgi:hypothetical protein
LNEPLTNAGQAPVSLGLDRVVVEPDGTEGGVPQRRCCSEVATTPSGGTQCVMRMVESRGDKYMVTEPFIANPRFRVQDASQKAEAENEKGKLHRGHPDG